MASGITNSLPPFNFAGGMPPEPVMRFTVDQYLELVRLGILEDDAPIELLDGWILPKMTKNPEHIYATRQVRVLLEQAIGAGYWVTSQDAIKLPESVPEPDSAVIRGSAVEFAHRLPKPADITLVVEVADSSLRRDRGLKKNVYARARLPEYWVVNLVTRSVEVFTDPQGEDRAADFRTRREYAETDELPLQLDGRSFDGISVSNLLPPKE